jgi:hypothetical protein
LPAHDRADLQRELTDAFDAFRAALRQALEAEAQRSVNDAIERLSSAGGPFRVVDAEVEVVIRRLSLSAQDDVSGPAPASASARHSSPRRARRTATRAAASAGGRGAVREAIIATFAAGGGEMTTEDVHAALTQRGVRTSVENLYQQLRRLVQAGELTRPSRGRYRRSDTAAAA